MSILASFDIGTRALRAFQTAIQTISHNLSNVDTPGYSRQRVLYATEPPDLIQNTWIGRGVRVEAIQRLRDEFFEAQWRRESATQGETNALAETYQAVETILQEPTDGGLFTRLSEFHSAWQELANNPTDPGVRAVLRQRGRTLMENFNAVRSDLTDLRQQADAQIRAEIPRVNAMARELFDLNKKIQQARLHGTEPNDALDRRDYLTGELGALLPVRALDRENGFRALYVGGAPLVEEAGAEEMTVVPKAGDTTGLGEVRWADHDEPVAFGGGRLGGLLTARDTVIPDAVSRLDELSGAIVSRINQTHRTALGLDGAREITGSADFTGTLAADGVVTLNGVDVNFFSGDDLISVAGRLNAVEASTGVHASLEGSRLVLTPADGATVGVTADPNGVFETLGILNDFFAGTPGDWRLSDAVAADIRHIAASLSGAPGDNAGARAVAALWEEGVLESGTRTFEAFHQEFLAEWGARSEAMSRTAESQGFLLEQIDNLRESVAGVSSDEELAQLVRYQRAYEMAARSVQTADEMLQTLLDMVHR